MMGDQNIIDVAPDMMSELTDKTDYTVCKTLHDKRSQRQSHVQSIEAVIVVFIPEGSDESRWIGRESR